MTLAQILLSLIGIIAGFAIICVITGICDYMHCSTSGKWTRNPMADSNESIEDYIIADPVREEDIPDDDK